MSNWEKFIRIISIVPVTFFFSLYSLISDKHDIAIASMLTGKIFGSVTDDTSKAFVLMLSNILYLVLFNIFFGNLISEDFRFSSVYLFSRLRNRKVWFYKRAFELLMISSVYALLFLVSNLMICTFCSTSKIELNEVKIFLVLFGLITMILAITTIIINLLAIKFGSTTAFIAVYISVIMLIFLSLKHESIPFLGKYYFVRLFNPLSGIVLNLFDNPIAQSIVAFYYFILMVLTFILGGRFVDNVDIALLDCESI